MDKPEHHFSDLNLIEMCGEAYRRRRLEKQKGTTVRLAVGSAVHEGRSHNLKQKIQTGENLPLDEIKDCTRDSTLEQFEQRELFAEDDYEGMSKPAVYQTAIDESVKFVEADYWAFQKSSIPVAVEKSLRIRLDDYPFNIGMKIDLIEKFRFSTRSLMPDEIINCKDCEAIRDCKTAAKKPRESVARLSEQLAIYSLAYQAWRKCRPDDCSLDYTIRQSRGRVENLRISYNPTEADCQAALHRLAMADEAIRKGIFIPAQPSHWKCNPAWCEFYSTCRYVIGKK